MMRRTARAARASREWWPEILCGCILAAVGFAGQKDDPLFAVFEGLVVAVAWAMGFRHRNLPLHRQVREIWETTRRIEDRGLGAPGPQSAHGPLARVLPLRRR